MRNHRCIVDDTGEVKHPYAYCIKPLDQMIDYEKIRKRSSATNMVGVTEGAQGLVNYATALVSDPRNAIANDCTGQWGNKYVLRSKIKCKNMDENIHTYINNVVDYNYLTEREDEAIGIIPATISSAVKINGLPLINALYEEPQQDCIKVKLPCHLIDKNNHLNNYSGYVEDVPIKVSQYDELEATGRIEPTPEQRAFRENLRDQNSEGYSNLYESIYNYLDNNPNLLPSQNFEINKNSNFDKDLLFNLYYLFLSVFLLFLLFKIIHKK